MKGAPSSKVARTAMKRLFRHPAIAPLPGCAFGGAVASACFFAVDTLLRDDFGASVSKHLALGLGLQLVWGALGGLALGVTLLLGERAAARLARHVQSGVFKIELFGAALLAALCTASTAVWVFSGERIARTSWVWIGPVVTLGVTAAAAASTLFLWRVAARRFADSRRPAFIVSALFLSMAGLLVYLDLTWLVALYARLHTLMEGCAWLAIWSVAVFWQSRAAHVLDRPGVLLAGSGMAFGAALSSLPGCLEPWTRALAYGHEHELYLGRTLRRLEDTQAGFEDPLGVLGKNSTALRLEKLLLRYDIEGPRLAPAWRTPATSTPGALFPDEPRRPNIVIYYVDTLRLDAVDPETMPVASRFLREGSLSFQRAYATGSDTATSVPGIIGGRYGVTKDATGELPQVAARAGYETVLVVPRSAREYLSVKAPRFRFANTIEIQDYDPGKEVWGYGADRPTATAVVERGLEQLGARDGRPLLLWLFQYDQHNFRQLDRDHVEALRDEAPALGPGQLDPRYRAVARSLDRGFGRVTTAISELGLADDTVLVFVSDHGESLGRQGFHAHSVHLWEELIHVPFGVRIPGVAPQRIDIPVSLTDLMPTLAPYFSHQGAYHGEDLRLRAAPDAPARRLPILFSSTVGGALLRIGILDTEGSHKLVLPIDAARPELYDLRAPDPDARNLAATHPLKVAELLQILVGTPVFPR